ncbi:MAG: carbohydrate-binding protein [Oscillospiraceae bacterium]
MLTIKITDKNGDVRAISQDSEYAQLLYRAAYEEGDAITIESTEGGVHLILQMEDSMAQSLVYLAGKSYTLAVPFGEQRSSYSPKSFTGEMHFMFVRLANAWDIPTRRDLAFNPYDGHKNETLFPHAIANVETRGEAVFAARNAIDGNIANAGHGPWPYQSWGIQQREDAEFTVLFGREVEANGVGVTIRCDFPHDNYWHTATVVFSDGSSEVISLNKATAPQRFNIAPRKITWAKLCCMKKDETDAAPFPALTAFNVFGSDV